MSGSVRARLAATEVRGQDDALLLVHHGTLDGFAVGDIAPFSHFGTRAAARQRLGGWHGEPPEDARLISGFLDIRNPLYLPDLNNNHDLHRILSLIAFSPADQFFDRAARDRLFTHEQETGEGLELLGQMLREHGYDGIGYRNLHEDPGSMAWIIFEASQLIVVQDGLLKDSRDPWELSEQEYTGPSIVRDIFEIDGCAEDYDHLWEELALFGGELPVMAKSADGWQARWLEGWEPPATMGLFCPRGTSAGFYMGGQLWLHPEARGAGRSALMINAAADMLGGCPAQNEKGLGFSPAGMGAHRAARRRIREQAIESGQLDPAFENDEISP